MRDLLALEIGELLVRAVGPDHGPQLVTLPSLGVAANGERHGAGEIDRERRVAGREHAQVHPARAHRLDRRGVREHAVEMDALAGAGLQVIDIVLEYFFVDGGILERRIGEEQERRILPLLRVRRRVGDQIVVLVAITLIEIAAVFARVGSRAPARRGTRPGRAGLAVSSWQVLSSSGSMYQRRHCWPRTARPGVGEECDHPRSLATA